MIKAQAAALFQRLFTGYSGAYGTYDPRMLSERGKKKPAHRAIRSQCTAECYLDHLSGRQPLGIYLLDDDQMLRFAAIDIDVYPIDHANISVQLNELALPMVVCSSKSGGAHIYVFFSRPENPACVRLLLKDISVALGHPTAEIFPKQNSRSGNDLGNFINLPFFGHPALNYACWDGETELDYEGFLELANSRQTTVEQLQFQLSKAGILQRSEGTPVVTPFNSGGRNEYLFNFGRKLFELIPDMESVVREIRKKNHEASENDHPNFGSQGPLPEKELQCIIASLKKILQDKPNNDLSAAIAGLNQKHAHIMIGGKARVLNLKIDPEKGWHIHDFSSPADFRSCYANQQVKIGKKVCGLGAAWLSHPGRRSYEGVLFYPGKTDENYFNTFRGFPVTPAKGDCSLYLEHIKNNICKCDEDLYAYILDWMADAIQNPAKRPGVALVIKGKQGVGKGVMVNVFSRLFGPYTIEVSQSSHLVGNFNAHLQNKLLVYADEAFWAGDKRAEGALKAIITEDKIAIEMKGIDVQSSSNFARLILASNNDWVVPASIDQRRFAVIEAGEARMQDAHYFKALLDQIEQGGLQALMQFLMDRDLNGTNLRKIPRTAALVDQQLHSLDSVGQWLFYSLDIGGFEEPIGGGLVEFDVWPRICPIAKLHECYLSFCKRNSVSHPVRSSVFGKKLNDFLPGIRKSRITIKKERKNIYELMSLDASRDEFIRINKLHSIIWDEDDSLV